MVASTPERNRGTRDDAPTNLDAVDAGDGCSLLLYAARGWGQGEPIDRLSGRLGWSHLAIDAEERDASTGERLIIDHRVGIGMQRRPHRPLDYEGRPRARIVLPQPVATELRLAAKRLVGSQYRLRASFRSLGDGDLDGTVCSQVVFECLPPDLQRRILRADVPLGPLGWLLRRANPHLVTPNQFAAAFGVPPAATLGAEDIIVQADTTHAMVEAARGLERAARHVAPRATGFVHREDCRLMVRVISIGLLPESDDLGTDWRFSFDLNGRGPSTVRSRRFGSSTPLINPRKIIHHEWVPHCDGHQQVNLSVHVTQFQGIRDTGSAQTDPVWTIPCAGQSIRDLRAHVDGRHEHAQVAVRVLVQAHHAVRHPETHGEGGP